MRAAPEENGGAEEVSRDGAAVGHGTVDGAHAVVDGEVEAAAAKAAAATMAGGGPAESSEPMVNGSEGGAPGESRTPPEAAGIPTAMTRTSADPSESGPKMAMEGNEKPASLPDAIAPQAIRR